MNINDYAKMYATGRKFMNSIDKMDELVQFMREHRNLAMSCACIGEHLYGQEYFPKSARLSSSSKKVFRGGKAQHVSKMLCKLVNAGYVKATVSDRKMICYNISDNHWVRAMLPNDRVITIPDPDYTRYQFSDGKLKYQWIGE